jgi:hypothetical protein
MELLLVAVAVAAVAVLDKTVAEVNNRGAVAAVAALGLMVELGAQAV